MVILSSRSEYASPLVIVKKSNGDMRVCVYYKKLNEKVIKDSYPILRVDDSLEALVGAKIFSSFDLKSAYNQIRVTENDQHKTVFTSSLGLFEFTRMTFGLSNAPATFQRVMSNLFREDVFNFVVCYMDDILVYSKTREGHIGHITLVMNKLRINFL